MPGSGRGGDCNERDLMLLRAMAPKHAVGPRRVVLGVSFEDLSLFVVGVLHLRILVGSEPWMTRILEKAYSP